MLCENASRLEHIENDVKSISTTLKRFGLISINNALINNFKISKISYNLVLGFNDENSKALSKFKRALSSEKVKKVVVSLKDGNYYNKSLPFKLNAFAMNIEDRRKITIKSIETIESIDF